MFDQFLERRRRLGKLAEVRAAQAKPNLGRLQRLVDRRRPAEGLRRGLVLALLAVDFAKRGQNICIFGLELCRLL